MHTGLHVQKKQELLWVLGDGSGSQATGLMFQRGAFLRLLHRRVCARGREQRAVVKSTVPTHLARQIHSHGVSLKAASWVPVRLSPELAAAGSHKLSPQRPQSGRSGHAPPCPLQSPRGSCDCSFCTHDSCTCGSSTCSPLFTLHRPGPGQGSSSPPEVVL